MKSKESVNRYIHSDLSLKTFENLSYRKNYIKDKKFLEI